MSTKPTSSKKSATATGRACSSRNAIPQSLPVEPSGNRVEPAGDALCASVPDRAALPRFSVILALRPIPSNKSDDKARPAPPPVLQIPPPLKIHAGLRQIPCKLDYT
jgi:hypothetical protein